MKAITKFETGKTYYMTYIGDSTMRVEWVCIKLTAKTAKFQRVNTDEIITRRIKEWDGVERVDYASYSMAPSMRADKFKQEPQQPEPQPTKKSYKQATEEFLKFVEEECQPQQPEPAEPVAKVVFNEHFQTYQTYIDGTLYEEFDTEVDASRYLYHAGYEIEEIEFYTPEELKKEEWLIEAQEHEAKIQALNAYYNSKY